jgi:hypothetical protein
MSTESAARPGRFHEVGFYHSDAEFGALIVPFVEGGVAAGQPVIIGYDDRKAGLLRSWLYDPAAVNFIADARLYATPARAIASYWKMFEEYTDAGATQIRIAGDVPHEGNGGRFAGWDRYECAANTVWGQFPVWSRCLYDATTAASRVLDIAARTHPRIVLPSGQFRDSGLYQDPGDFRPLPSDPHPLERSAPALEMTDPLPAQARRAVTSIGHGQVPGTVLQDLEIGVTEAIGHARLHGHPPRDRADLGRIRADHGPRPRHQLGARRPAGRTGTRMGRSQIPRSRTLAHPHARPRHRADPVRGRLYRPARRRARYLTAWQRQHDACGHASNRTGTPRDPGDTDRAFCSAPSPAGY